MANLDAAADKAVHDAVDAFMEGRLAPDFSGETVFETKHSRYRLRDGVVYAAPSDGLIGAELVGWLMETSRRSVVESAWQPGSRAVLVDRARGRNIIVTSSTRLLHLEAVENGSQPPPSVVANPIPLPSLPPPSMPSMSRLGGGGEPARRGVVSSTPLPPRYGPLPAPSPAPPQRPSYTPHAPHAPHASHAFPVIPTPPVPVPPSAPRRAALHLPPRPIGGSSPRIPQSPGIPSSVRAPMPSSSYGDAERISVVPEQPPPVRVAPLEEPPTPARVPDADVPWELKSSEIELEDVTDEDSGGNDATAPPIPLVKPRDPR